MNAGDLECGGVQDGIHGVQLLKLCMYSFPRAGQVSWILDLGRATLTKVVKKRLDTMISYDAQVATVGQSFC